MALDWLDLSDEKIVRRFREAVALMRELGIVQGFGLTLGPEPRPLTKLEAIEKRAQEEGTPEARRAARIEVARDDVRSKLGRWDLPEAACDVLIDPAIFEAP
jgi:hypothetical protein